MSRMNEAYVHNLILSRSEEQLLRMKKEVKTALNALRKTGLSNREFMSGTGDEYITGCIKLHEQMVTDIDQAIAALGSESLVTEAKRIHAIQIEVFGVSHTLNQDRQSDLVKRFIEYTHHHVQSNSHTARAASSVRGAYMSGELSEAMFLAAKAIYRDEDQSNAIDSFIGFCDQHSAKARFNLEINDRSEAAIAL